MTPPPVPPPPALHRDGPSDPRGFPLPWITHPDAGRRAGWRDTHSQWLRFEVCTSALDLDTVGSVLDVGCGLGDFLAFCRRRGFGGSFTGIDLLPSMIDTARLRHPADPAARFEVANLLELPPHIAHQRFDLVVACGSLSLRVPHYDAYLNAALTALWSVTAGALVLVLPSSRAPKRVAGIEDDFVCHDPAKLRARALHLSPYLCLREDFLPTDLALYLYRNPPPSTARPALPSHLSPPLPPEDIAALYLERDLPAAALPLLESIPLPERTARVWLLLGETLRALSRRQEALVALTRALTLDPSLTAARLAIDGL